MTKSIGALAAFTAAAVVPVFVLAGIWFADDAGETGEYFDGMGFFLALCAVGVALFPLSLAGVGVFSRRSYPGVGLGFSIAGATFALLLGAPTLQLLING